MSEHVSSNPSGVQKTEPALLVTTQTTIPVLTQLMVAFSLAAVGIASGSNWQTPIRFPFYQLTTKELSLCFFVTSVFLFVFATESCIKSHSWDYFAVSEDRRRFLNLSDKKEYIAKCLKLSKLWHSRAVWFFRVGVILSIIGSGILVWPLSRIASWLIAGYVPMSAAVTLWANYRDKKSFESG